MKTDRFWNFVYDVHPDPDYIMTKSIGEMSDVLAKLANQYFDSIGKTHCMICGKEIDEGFVNSICVSCFTSKA